MSSFISNVVSGGYARLKEGVENISPTWVLAGMAGVVGSVAGAALAHRLGKNPMDGALGGFAITACVAKSMIDCVVNIDRAIRDVGNGVAVIARIGMNVIQNVLNPPQPDGGVPRLPTVPEHFRGG